MAARPRDAPLLRIEKNGDVLVDRHVVPNAAKTRPDGLHGEPGQPALRLQAPPVDGKANQTLIKWLTHSREAPPKAITLVRGETSRRKQWRVSAAVAGQTAWTTWWRSSRHPEISPRQTQADPGR